MAKKEATQTDFNAIEKRLGGMIDSLVWESKAGCWVDSEYVKPGNKSTSKGAKVTYTYAEKECTHSGCVKIPFDFGKSGSELYACSSYVSDYYYKDKDLVVSFNNESEITPVQLNPLAQRLLPKSKFPKMYQESVPMITLKWADYDIPPVSFEFFKDLVRAMKTKKMKVLIYCLAGHGRTGTGMAAILHAAGFSKANPKANIVQWIRKKYCNRAIETNSQIDWLRDAGANVGSEKGSKPLTYSY